MMTLTLEALDNGAIRATGRIDGGTSAYLDGTPENAKALCLNVLSKFAFAHKLADGSFDLTYINLNDAAKRAMAESKPRATVKVTLDDGDHFVSTINLDLAGAQNYYRDYVMVTEDEDGRETKRAVVMTEEISDEVDSFRAESSKVPTGFHDRQPVIVRSDYTPGKFTLGIQYWTPAMIRESVSTNTDRTISHFVAMLY